MKNVISLFSGALGLDIGLDEVGFSLRLGVEKDPWAAETIRLNRPRLPVIEKPIEDVTSTEILEKAGLESSQVTVISAGPCCQSFSTVGNRKSIADPRGNLFREFCRVVADIRPRFFIMENVKGILSAAVKHRILNERGPGHPPLSKDEVLGSALNVLCNELANLDYYVVFGLLNSADFGVPQKRWRVFFIGSRDGEEICLPAPTHQDPRAARNGKTLNSWITLREALSGVRPKHWCEFTQDRLALLRRLEPGQNWRDLPPNLHRKALGAALDSWGGRSGFCRRLSWNEPSPTLTTAPDGRATTLCHPTANRPLSVEEYAALQQFPTDWEFAGSVRQQYMQIGNAVPVGLGRAVGRALMQTIRNTERHGIAAEQRNRCGQVVCGDPILEQRLRNRHKTQLHPPRLRTSPDPEEARKWLLASAGQQVLQFSES